MNVQYTVQYIPRDNGVLYVVLASQESQNTFVNSPLTTIGIVGPQGRGDNQSINQQKNGEKMEGRKE